MKITFQPDGDSIEALPEQTILEVARRGEIDIVATCGSKGVCNSCRVKIIQGNVTPPTEREIGSLGEEELSNGFRLSCQSKALTDAVVLIAPVIAEESFQILSHAERRHYSIDPDVRKRHVVFPETSEEHQSSDFEEIQNYCQKPIDHIDLVTLQSLPTSIAKSSRNLTIVGWNQRLIAIEAGDTTEHVYGIAFDVGTTTVVGYLLDLRTGKELAVASELNAQAVYGGDVMSRITFAQQDMMGLSKLHSSILITINGIIGELFEKALIDRYQIYEITIVGNTCMHHLFLNVDPIHLGLAPYFAAIRKQYTCRAADLGIKIAPQGRVVMLPLIAGFVGADTVAAILATGVHKSQHIKLMLDIGTNGEIALGSRDRLVACSAAAGTAFEGAQITHGMRGAIGAIDKVSIDDDVHCHVIGEGPALGICGSGLVDAIAQMLDAGVINANGRLLRKDELQESVPPRIRERITEEKGSKRAFILVYGEYTKNGESIVITQKDVRELQLAKGAMAAGIKMLIKTLDIQKEDISEILLAGAFGNYIDNESAVRIGLIPPLPYEKIRSVGNAAGLGSQLALLSGKAKEEAGNIARTTEHIALTNDPEFQLIFADEMRFPE